jgi:hypothetical protein
MLENKMAYIDMINSKEENSRKFKKYKKIQKI